MSMQEIKKKIVQPDPWTSLRSLTGARIALGRVGAALPLSEVLALKMAHAQARDAVFSEIDIASLQPALQSSGFPVYLLHSQASERSDYLQRPGSGRLLNKDSVDRLRASGEPGCDIVIVLADGLSAAAVNTHAIPLLTHLVTLLQPSGYAIGPVCLVQQGRVAVADEIGSLLGARLSLILIGERPGLSSPDSLGAYVTYNPRPGLTDEARNCISNIHAAGLSYPVAAAKINYLVQASLRLQLSGVGLKEDDSLLL